MTPQGKVLVLASTFPANPGDGTPAFVRDLSAELADAFEVHLVVPMVSGGTRVQRDGALTIKRFRYFLRPWQDLADGAILENLRARPSRYLQVPFFILSELAAVARAVRQYRPDVIHAHWIFPQGFVAAVVAPRTPLVVTAHGGDLYAMNSRPMTALKRTVLRRAHHVTVVNHDMAEVVRGLGVPAERIAVAPMGADLEAVQSERPTAERTRSGRARLVFVGRLVEKKGVHVLLHALRDLDPHSYELRIVGDGPMEQELRDLARGLSVAFVGRLGRRDVVRELLAAHIAVFPSVLAVTGDQDGLPVALLEAMGAECAPIVSDLPGMAQAIVDGESGLVVPSGDSQALSAAVQQLIEHPELQSMLGAAARRQAEEKHSISAVGRTYRSILAQAIADR